MCDQLKAFGKCLILGFLLLPVIAEEFELDAGRLIEGDGNKTLQTAVWSYEKNGITLDLIGAVHIADAKYYHKLNTRFKEYDAVFFEMVADPPAIKALQNPKKGKVHKKNAGDLNKLYSLYQTMMDLSLQATEIDYAQPNFIHADMTQRQFERAQNEAGETIMSAAMGTNFDLSEIDQGLVMRAMMTGDSTLLKTELIGLLATADDDLGDESNHSVLINSRNDTCLAIVRETLQENEKLRKVALFYGAAHLPDFHRKLIETGWSITQNEWLNAWKFKTKQH